MLLTILSRLEKKEGSFTPCGCWVYETKLADAARVKQTVSDLDSSFKNGILRSRMGAAAARSGAPCVPTATPGPWDIPPAIGDAWFIHYPIYTGCVAARLETRSAAQRADHKPDKKTAVATPAL